MHKKQLVLSKMTSIILATTAMTISFSGEELKATTTTENVSRQHSSRMPVFKDPQVKNPAKEKMQLFTSLEAKNSKIALTKALNKIIAVSKKTEHILDIKALTMLEKWTFDLLAKITIS